MKLVPDSDPGTGVQKNFNLLILLDSGLCRNDEKTISLTYYESIKNDSDKKKHGIDFESAKFLWNDPDRIEILAPYPVEDRYILIGKIESDLWTAIYTVRKRAVRIISVRRSRKKESELYEKEKLD